VHIDAPGLMLRAFLVLFHQCCANLSGGLVSVVFAT
jgi:hypothetical protein